MIVALFLRSGPESAGPVASSSVTIVIDSPARQKLSDGSWVDLQEGAVVRESFTGQLRQVVLEHGTAHFQVVKDPARPFVVQAGGLKVRAVGTAFSVIWASSGIEVLVTEGRVAVVPADAGWGRQPEAIAGAGERVTMVGPTTLSKGLTLAVATLTETELAERMAWRLPRLHIADAPLAEVVALLNRHNRRQLVIEDDSLRSLQISGVLRADNQAAFLEALQVNFGIEPVPQGTDEIRLRRRTAAIIN